MSNSGWDVRLTASAGRELASLSDALAEATSLLAEELSENPFPPDAEALKGHRDWYRVPFASGWRMVYRVSRSNRRVLITRIRPRGSAYEGLEP
jgi:mRNA-degrading endonuclease RelE of RelBE toxin-antitoxin system